MKKISIIFFLVMFVVGTDTFLISPLLPTLQEAYRIPTEWSGWMVSTYALGYALFALIVGPISDGVDRRKMMISGLVAFGLSTFFCGLAPNFWTMILFRLLAGISASFVTPQVWASIPILVEQKNIIKVMGYTTAGLSISQMIGLPIGGFLASFSWRMPFYVISVSALALVFIIVVSLPSIPSVIKERKQSFWRVYQNLLRTPRSIKYFLAYFIFQTGNFAAFSFIGSWFTEGFSLSVAATGAAMLGLGLGNTIGSLFGSTLVKKLGEPKSLFIAVSVLIILYMGLPFSANLMVAEIFFFFIFLIGGFVFPVFMSTLQSMTVTARGTVSALANATMYGGTTIGGIMGGILFGHFSGFVGVSFFTAIFYIISLLIFSSSGEFKQIEQSSSKNSIS